MKIGVLSDVHGNAHALATVLSEARRLGVQRLVCGGDYVGYYYEPRRCLDLLRDWDVESVRGNHEDMLAALLERPELASRFRQRYGSGVSEAAGQLTPAETGHLASLPSRKTVHAGGKTILLCHGAPWDPAAYVYPDAAADVFARCAEEGADVVVLGHTHHRFLRRVGATLIVNPGSVGQPRDRRPGAAWALLETETGECTLHSHAYDTAPIEARARATDPHLPYLWEVLTRC